VLKKHDKPRVRDDMRPEYDFAGGVRGKYSARYRKGMNIVLLDRDVASVFLNSAAVNKALRALLDAVPARRPKRRREDS
jgi:hypothetical protein